VFAPAGGVETGWQSVFRSRSIGGPYEAKIVMAQGASRTNGPHQGAWLQMPQGEHWFMHFQDKRAYGRVVHLQPMRWKDDWPIIGENPDGDGVGQPVSRHRVPVAGSFPLRVPPTGDEFSRTSLGLQWQWNANWQSAWYSLSDRPGFLRLYSQYDASHSANNNLWNTPAILLQKLPAERFTVDTRIELHSEHDGDRAGLVMYGLNYAWLGLRRERGQTQLVYATCVKAEANCQEQVTPAMDAAPSSIALRMTVREGGIATFSYSVDQRRYIPIGEPFVATMGRWVGAQMGLFSAAKDRETDTKSYADIDYFRVSR
jgi:beta-xylosidase